MNYIPPIFSNTYWEFQYTKEYTLNIFLYATTLIPGSEFCEFVEIISIFLLSYEPEMTMWRSVHCYCSSTWPVIYNAKQPSRVMGVNFLYQMFLRGHTTCTLSTDPGRSVELMQLGLAPGSAILEYIAKPLWTSRPHRLTFSLHTVASCSHCLCIPELFVWIALFFY